MPHFHVPLLSLLLLCGFNVVAVEPAGLTVFAAASATSVLTEVAAAYEAERHVHVTCSFGSSAMLAKQIEQGAPADLFLSADAKWMDYLAQRQAISNASRTDLLGNALVIIAPKAKPLTVQVDPGFDFAGSFAGRLAVGDPASVPVGIYTQEAFTALGWWDTIKGRLAPAADVRAALKLVELGEMDAGVVYSTDAKASTQVIIAATIPTKYHTPIRYPVALTTSASPAAAAFLVYLQGPTALAVFTAAGFTDPKSP
jgi:molybdate transport system substrate-binding protein